MFILNMKHQRPNAEGFDGAQAILLVQGDVIPLGLSPAWVCFLCQLLGASAPVKRQHLQTSISHIRAVGHLKTSGSSSAFTLLHLNPPSISSSNQIERGGKSLI